MRLSHSAAGLGGHLEGGFEGAPLRGGEDGARPLGPPRVLPIVLPRPRRALPRLDVQILIIAFLCSHTYMHIHTHHYTPPHPTTPPPHASTHHYKPPHPTTPPPHPTTHLHTPLHTSTPHYTTSTRLHTPI